MRGSRVVCAPRVAPKKTIWLQWLAGALLLALMLVLAGGVGYARAASPAAGGTLAFVQPSYRGVVGGPPGARVVIKGGSWQPDGAVSLSVAAAGGCGGVSVGSFSTDQHGQFTAGFLWPLQANHPGAYRVCAVQAGYGSALTSNTFSVLTSKPASLEFSPGSIVAGETITVTGENWVPGPQTLDLEIVPCKSVCDAAPVARMSSIPTTKDGTFSQQLTISAGAASGGYYAQAANVTATLFAVSDQPIQVTGQAAPSGTPVAGISPTTTATRTTQQDAPDSSGTSPSPFSQASSSLKNALLAAVLGLLALLVIVGGLAFVIGRSRGPDLPTRPKAEKEDGPLKDQPETARRATWRSPSPVGVAAHQPGRATVLAQSYQSKGENLDGDVLNTPGDGETPGNHDSGDEYPWEERISPPVPDPDEPEQNKNSRSSARRFRRPGPPRWPWER